MVEILVGARRARAGRAGAVLGVEEFIELDIAAAALTGRRSRPAGQTSNGT